MNSKQFFSDDNFNSLLWDCYWFGYWLLLALKLTIIIIERDDMVGRKWSREEVGNYLQNNDVVTMLNDIKDIWTCLNLYATLFMA